MNPTVTLTEMGKKFWSDPDKVKAMLGKIPMQRFAGQSKDFYSPTVFSYSKFSLVEVDEVVDCIQ